MLRSDRRIYPLRIRSPKPSAGTLHLVVLSSKVSRRSLPDKIRDVLRRLLFWNELLNAASQSNLER